MTAERTEHSWRARPFLAGLVRTALLCVPFVASSAWVYLLAQLLPDGASRSWWGLTLLLVTAVLVAVLVERGARRLLPLAVILKLSMIFPDRAPSRLKLARTAALRQPKAELIWNGSAVRPTTTSDLIVDLVAALGAHDRRTRGHSERVRVLCDMLATELKLDNDARDRLRWAALLHDVGKMTVSTRILNKPSRLDAGEFDRIKQHPQAGAELAAPLLPWLAEWGDGIVDHHEKYDGTGYPNGKAGQGISASGRIIGLVDAFETMTAARPYKKAMATKAAREELARCAGTHFDPVYVRAFLGISLPRVLWAMGPLSFVLQLPFLRPLAQAGAKSGAISAQAAAAAAGAAGAAVLATGSVAVVAEASGAIELGGVRPPAAAEVVPAPQDAEPVAETGPVATEAPRPEPSPTSTPTSTAVPQEPTPSAQPAPAEEPLLPTEQPTPSSTASASATPSSSPSASASPSSTPSPAPVDEPADPVEEPVDPVDEPVDPVEEPADPVDEPTDPVEEPADPVDEPTDPVDEPTDPVDDPTDPVDDPTDPVDNPTDPVDEPTDPVEEPTDPVEEPTDPVEEPTDPVDPGGSVPGSGPVVVSGPAATTTSRVAEFELRALPGVSYECQVLGNVAGVGSNWQPCSGELSYTILRDGENTLRIRDAVTRAQLESWTWTVTSTAVSGRALPLDGVLLADEPGQPGRSDLGLRLLALLSALALPVAAAARRLRSPRP